MKNDSTSATVQFAFADEDVCQRVYSYLSSRHFPRFRDLEIEVRRGVVTVQGTVGSFHERQVALNSCRRVAGVLELIDAIEVAGEKIGNNPPLWPR